MLALKSQVPVLPTSFLDYPILFSLVPSDNPYRFILKIGDKTIEEVVSLSENPELTEEYEYVIKLFRRLPKLPEVEQRAIKKRVSKILFFDFYDLIRAYVPFSERRIIPTIMKLEREVLEFQRYLRENEKDTTAVTESGKASFQKEVKEVMGKKLDEIYKENKRLGNCIAKYTNSEIVKKSVSRILFEKGISQKEFENAYKYFTLANSCQSSRNPFQVLEELEDLKEKILMTPGFSLEPGLLCASIQALRKFLLLEGIPVSPETVHIYFHPGLQTMNISFSPELVEELMLMKEAIENATKHHNPRRFFVFFVLINFYDSPIGHANTIIIDSKNRSLSWFEPEGQMRADIRYSRTISNMIDQFLFYYLHRFGISHIEKTTEPLQRTDTFCATWSAMLAYLRVKLPNQTIGDVVSSLNELDYPILLDFAMTITSFAKFLEQQKKGNGNK